MNNSSPVVAVQVAMDQSDNICFYCGLPFEPVSLPVDDPFYKRFTNYAKKTTMRFYTPRKPGEEYEPPIILAHSWCNSQARPLSFNDRLALKERLTLEVQEQNGPPWEHLHAIKTDKFIQRLEKKRLKETLSQASDHCYYCGMPFDIVPVDPGQPFYRKLKSWAKKTIQTLPAEDGAESKTVLTHQWCANKTMNLSAEHRVEFKAAQTARCTGAETMPWIDKTRLRKYIQQGGDLMEFLKRQDEALSNAKKL